MTRNSTDSSGQQNLNSESVPHCNRSPLTDPNTQKSLQSPTRQTIVRSAFCFQIHPITNPTSFGMQCVIMFISPHLRENSQKRKTCNRQRQPSQPSVQLPRHLDGIRSEHTQTAAVSLSVYASRKPANTPLHTLCAPTVCNNDKVARGAKSVPNARTTYAYAGRRIAATRRRAECGKRNFNSETYAFGGCGDGCGGLSVSLMLKKWVLDYVRT